MAQHNWLNFNAIAMPGGQAITGESAEMDGERYLLWIDRVGTVLLCLGERISLGGPVSEPPSADLSLQANLSRLHAEIVRSGEGYYVQAAAMTSVAGRAVHDRTNLADGNEIGLGETVKLRFRLPTIVSGTARLDFVSDHRPANTVDSVVLMEDTCILGPGSDSHIRCPDWNHPILLHRSGGKLCCKSRGDIYVDNRHAKGSTPLEDGSIVTGVDGRFRVEALQATG